MLDEKEEEFLPWLAQYLVMKRVSIEPNFHPLYGNFVTEIGHDKFEQIVLEETYRNVKVCGVIENLFLFEFIEILVESSIEMLIARMLMLR